MKKTIKAKIQKNDYGNYMIVQADKSTNSHIGPGDWFEVQKMTPDEIVQAYNELKKPPTLDEMKDFLKGVEGFCKSNVTSTDNSYTWGDLFRVVSK